MSGAGSNVRRPTSTKGKSFRHYVDIRAGYGRSGIQSVFFLNGGGAAALLAFLGNLAIANHTYVLTGHLGAIKAAFICLGIGVVLAATSNLAAFLTQNAHLRAAESASARRLSWVAVAMVLTSLGCFVVGIAIAANELLTAF